MPPFREEVRVELQAIFKAIANLKALSDDKKSFTIDGRLVGDIGEIVAQFDYNLKLTDGLTRRHDAKDLATGHEIQIKATFKDTLGFMTAYKDIYYLGLKLHENGTYEEIYNGPASYIHDAFQSRSRLQRGLLESLPVKKLHELSAAIPADQRILRR